MIQHYLIASILLPAALSQLTGSVGPTTDYATKAANRVCDITDYGAEDGSSDDVGPIIEAAWSDCAEGGLVYIPPGDYQLLSSISLDHGSSSAVQWDGIIYRGEDGDFDGHMMYFQNNEDFELFSGNSQGAFQGYGYEYIQNGEFGPRFIRFVDCNNWSFHGIALIDSPAYYVVIETCTNGEVYNLILRGISGLGETDGIDISGDNNHVHDVEVTNGDECVTVKSPSSNFLIESIHCNWSGGTAIGSLGTDTAISNIEYNRLYMKNADACYIKTNGGDGYVTGVSWNDVIINGGAYILAVNEGWGTDRGSIGVQISDLTYTDWRGANFDNARPVIRMECDADVPCYDITFDNVNLWTTDGDYVTWTCSSAYGEGACLRDADDGDYSSYDITVSTITAPPDYSFSTMPNDLPSAFPTTESFTIPPIPTTYFPGAAPTSALLDLDSAGGMRKKRDFLGRHAIPTW